LLNEFFVHLCVGDLFDWVALAPILALWIGGILRDPKSVREETAKRVFKALHQKTDFR
jgi:hypothetical protein